MDELDVYTSGYRFGYREGYDDGYLRLGMQWIPIGIPNPTNIEHFIRGFLEGYEDGYNKGSKDTKIKEAETK